MPTLNAVANLGLVLFLFLVGLECDLRHLLSNWRTAASVSLLGMILPFGLGGLNYILLQYFSSSQLLIGCAISYGLYNEFSNDSGTVPVEFGTFLLFVGLAMAITVR